jgi:hypothetical protein
VGAAVPLFGVIQEITGNQALIAFGDGDAGRVLLDQIRPLAVQVGQDVLSRRKMGPQHFPAKLVDRRGEQVCVNFSDNDEDEWTTLAALRIPCQPLGPAAVPVQVASHMAFAKNLRPGDRVWAPWQKGVLFAGTVDKLRDEEAHVHFDDGDAGWVHCVQLLPLEIPMGLRVVSSWKMKGQYRPGIVAEVDGERIHIHYDDGNKEWTKAAALALPLEPFGPDARPTRNVAGRPAIGWIVAIGIGILFALVRAGCRH